MRLIKRLIELAFVLLVLSFLMKNKNVDLNITYYGLSEPITVQFWELVLFLVSLGIIIAALGDFISQIKWVRERSRMIKTDKEHKKVVDDLNKKIDDLAAENERLSKNLTDTTRKLEAAEAQAKESRSTSTGYSGSSSFASRSTTTASGTGVSSPSSESSGTGTTASGTTTSSTSGDKDTETSEEKKDDKTDSPKTA